MSVFSAKPVPEIFMATRFILEGELKDGHIFSHEFSHFDNIAEIMDQMTMAAIKGNVKMGKILFESPDGTITEIYSVGYPVIPGKYALFSAEDRQFTPGHFRNTQSFWNETEKKKNSRDLNIWEFCQRWALFAIRVDEKMIKPVIKSELVIKA
jgi:hypothetical protein